MFLRQMIRKKDGKEHRYFSVVENKRVADGRVVQRHVLYLGEINDTQQLAWRKSIEVFDEGADHGRCRCSLTIAAKGFFRTRPSFACDCRRCGCGGRGSGAHAGSS
jgi:hypothetical protein